MFSDFKKKKERKILEFFPFFVIFLQRKYEYPCVTNIRAYVLSTCWVILTGWHLHLLLNQEMPLSLSYRLEMLE